MFVILALITWNFALFCCVPYFCINKLLRRWLTRWVGVTNYKYIFFVNLWPIPIHWISMNRLMCSLVLHMDLYPMWISTPCGYILMSIAAIYITCICNPINKTGFTVCVYIPTYQRTSVSWVHIYLFKINVWHLQYVTICMCDLCMLMLPTHFAGEGHFVVGEVWEGEQFQVCMHKLY